MGELTRTLRDARISIVVPVYNEEEVLPELRERLVATLLKTGSEFEVIFVDDGSNDRTPALLEEMQRQDPRLKCVRFSRNFGHQAAVSAGLHYAGGDLACVMDADLQDPPEVVLSLLAEWEKGSDVVYAIREERKENPLLVACYRLFYRLLGRLSSVSIPLDAGDFALVSRRVLDEMKRLPEKERFVRGLRAWVGFRQTGVRYQRAARQGGRSKYSLLGLARLAMNGLVSFSDKPLIYVMLFGILISAVAAVYGFYLVGVRLIAGGIVTGYSSLMAAILFLSGIQLVGLGVVGLYMSKIFLEVKGRPTWVVHSLHGTFETASGMESSGAQPTR